MIYLSITIFAIVYGFGHSYILQILHSTIVKKGNKTVEKISHFCKRWPELRLHKGDSFPVQTNCTINFLKKLLRSNGQEDSISEYGIKDKPAQIYNCGMPLEFRSPKFIAAKGTKKVQQCSSGSKNLDNYACLCHCIWSSYTNNGGICWQAFQ